MGLRWLNCSSGWWCWCCSCPASWCGSWSPCRSQGSSGWQQAYRRACSADETADADQTVAFGLCRIVGVEQMKSLHDCIVQVLELCARMRRVAQGQTDLHGGFTGNGEIEGTQHGCAMACRDRRDEVGMPTVLRVAGYRLFFFSGEGNEPPHVHAAKDGNAAKYWLDVVTLAMNKGFRSHELNELHKIVAEHRVMLREAWNAHFGNQA